MKRRGSGILLHITSLPSMYGIGDMGPAAYGFADFLADTKQSLWQILPLNPTSPVYGNSPYSSFSAFAGNPYLISPELMVKERLLDSVDIESAPKFPSGKVDYTTALAFRERMLSMAYEKAKSDMIFSGDFERFCVKQAYWLDDYCLFMSIKQHLDGAHWNRWPDELRDRSRSALDAYLERLKDKVQEERFRQYIFFRQWNALKIYCESRGIRIIGDIPIYINFDSSDVWSHPDVFRLDDEKRLLTVAGVPPDYFSATGQLWGHPVYNWDLLKETDYAWWIKRIRHNVDMFHMFRLDHFRGFIAYWEVAATETNAVKGRWVEAPARDFFTVLLKHFPCLPLIAEDLGIITPDVRKVMDDFGFPGMKVLLFAFGEDLPSHPYAPHNYVNHCVVYTGTHDNNTIRGWFRREVDAEMRKRLFSYMGREVPEDEIHWDIIRLAMMSVADVVIIPMQDLLGMGEEGRMNLPASRRGNWEWRLRHEELSPELGAKLTAMTTIYGRSDRRA